MDAPIVIPVRVVDENDAPLEGVRVLLGRPGAIGGSGRYNWFTDSQGRVTIYGAPAGETYMVHTKVDRPQGGATLGSVETGESAPFTGQPGETVPEVVVVVSGAPGHIAGILLDPEGRPLAGADVQFILPPVKGIYANQFFFPADYDGSFLIRGVQPDEYATSMVFTYSQEPPRELYALEVVGLEVASGMVTDLGAIQLQRVSPEAAGSLYDAVSPFEPGSRYDYEGLRPPFRRIVEATE